MIYKRIGVALVLLGALGAGVYLVYFHRPPTADILAANAARSRKSMPGLGGKAAAMSQVNLEDVDFDNIDDSTLSKLQWRDFIERNKYVSIGSMFNKCGEFRISPEGKGLYCQSKSNITQTPFLVTDAVCLIESENVPRDLKYGYSRKPGSTTP